MGGNKDHHLEGLMLLDWWVGGSSWCVSPNSSVLQSHSETTGGSEGEFYLKRHARDEPGTQSAYRLNAALLDSTTRKCVHFHIFQQPCVLHR
jgi:hypothetical protein